MRGKRDADPLPDEFSSYEEAGEFWDGHDTTDYPGAFAEEPVEVHATSLRRHFEVEIDEDLFSTLRERAGKARVSVRRLVGELLRQQLLTSS
jgi:CopG antitoxin of type II toxin-antitoxin system